VVVDCLQMRRQRDKTSKSFKGRQQCKLVTGIEGRGAKTASSGTKDGFCVVDWVNGVGRERAGGVRSKKSRVLHPASGRNARERPRHVTFQRISPLVGHFRTRVDRGMCQSMFSLSGLRIASEVNMSMQSIV
jgi:hypothetical protein